MKTTFEIEYEQINSIVNAMLRETRDDFEGYLRQYENGKDWVAVFEVDREKDIKMLKKHVKACDRLLKWYGGEERQCRK